jgi:RHS repeat-associated protein
VHSGFKTDIKVCGVQDNSVGCQTTGTNGYGKILSMSREFDESGAVIKTVDALGGITEFFYDAARSPVRLVDAQNFETTAVYNNVGHRTSVTDPNRGTWAYQYNGFGELKQQSDARALNLSQVFDNLGRLTSRNWAQPDRFNPASLINLSDTFTYENTTNTDSNGFKHYGTLISAVRSGEGTVTESYVYDGLNRPVRKNYVGANVATRSWTLFETTEYDPNFGRPVRKNFPSAPGIEAQKIYMGYTLGGDPMQTGYADSYLPSDPRSSNPTRYLRRDEASNARGQILTSRFGSGDNSQAYQWLVSEYDLNTGWLLSRCSNLTICAGVAQSGSAIDTAATMKLGYEYDIFGNLSKSVNVGKRPGSVTISDVTSEVFGYDVLHRMTTAQRNTAPIPITYSYSAVGNLQKKTDFSVDSTGAYNYGSTAPRHGVKQVTLSTLQGGGSMFYGYDANGNVNGRGRSTTFTDTFGYDIDNRPQFTQIVSNKSGTSRIDFYLSATGAKALQVTPTRTIIYAGAYEAEYNGSVVVASRTYLAEGVLHNGVGDALQTVGLSFMHQDRLGSALVITDKGGNILQSDGLQFEFRTFDAFGKARDNAGGDTNLGNLFASNPNGKRNRKGFTGHEHLDEVGLIHMNGRAYDYNLGRFYGVDPVIQFPTNSQSLNGYSYLMNNPLAGTDPTGYCVMPTGSHICSDNGTSSVQRNLIEQIAGTLRKGGSVTFKGVNEKDAQALKSYALDNGYSVSSSYAQKSQTDGSRGGASKIAADILSLLQKEPLDADGSVRSKSAVGKDYTFPIDEVSVTIDSEGVNEITGHFDVDGTASENAVPNLRKSFSNVSGSTASGQKWTLNFTFALVKSGGNIHMNWFTQKQTSALVKFFSKKYRREVSSGEIVASTEYGSNTMSFNPAFKSVNSIIQNFGIFETDAKAVFDYVQGSFAHEFEHGAGIGHMSNSTNAMTSYSPTRRVNFNDLIRWCYLSLENKSCFK